MRRHTLLFALFTTSLVACSSSDESGTLPEQPEHLPEPPAETVPPTDDTPDWGIGTECHQWHIIEQAEQDGKTIWSFKNNLGVPFNACSDDLIEVHQNQDGTIAKAVYENHSYPGSKMRAEVDFDVSLYDEHPLNYRLSTFNSKASCLQSINNIEVYFNTWIRIEPSHYPSCITDDNQMEFLLDWDETKAKQMPYFYRQNNVKLALDISTGQQ
ncbi:hypothetical protein [Shewanella fidelis]|uniref:hypothetical protein n=1 Tax=Shewanella fidelis TaxID=173509 RepID=UPI0004921F42|nr:hypothetical protein [Shewanella fidelis]